MNIIESITNELNQNKFENSGEYKLLIMKSIQQHKHYKLFCHEITSELNTFKVINYHITPRLLHSKEKDYKCALVIGNENHSYKLHMARDSLEGLQEESLLLHYVRMGEIQSVNNMIEQVYASLERLDFGSITIKMSRIKQAIFDAYKKNCKDIYDSTNNRLKSEAHILMCSDDIKNHVDSKRRSQIRNGVISCLKKARTMGHFDDIRYFLVELEVEEIMES